MSSDNSNMNPAQAEEKASRARARIDQDLDELQNRFSVNGLVDEGVSRLRESGGGEYFKNLAVSAKQNPLPTLLIGAGIAWLMANERRGTSSQYGGSSYDTNESKPGLGDRVSDGLDSVRRSAAEAADRTRDGVDAAKARVHDGLGAASDSASSGVSQLRSSTRDAGEHISRSAAEARAQVSHRARAGANSVARSWDHLASEQPLALGAIALALGALCGAGLPATRREDELMGEASDEAIRQAKARGEEHLATAKDAVKAAGTAASEEAQRQGVHIDSARDVAAQVKSTAATVAESAKEAAAREVKGDANGASRSGTAAGSAGVARGTSSPNSSPA